MMTSTVRTSERSVDRDEAVLAFEQHYERHRSMLIRFATSRGASDPEIVADRALLDTYQAIPRLRSSADAVVEAYLIRAATSHIANEASAEIRDRTTNTANSADSDGLDRPGLGFEDGLVDRLELLRLLDHLTPNQRTVLELRFLDDLAPAEIGRRLGKSETTIRQLQHRGINRLRRVLFGGALLIGAVVLASILRAGTAPEQQPADQRPVERPTDASVPAPGPDDEGAAEPTPTTIATSPDPAAGLGPTTPSATTPGGSAVATPAPLAPSTTSVLASTSASDPAAGTLEAGPAAYEPFDLGLTDGSPFGTASGLSSYGFGDDSWSIRMGEGDLRFDAIGLDYLDPAGNRLATRPGALRVTAATNPLSLTRPLPEEAFGDGEYWVAFLVRLDAGGIGDAFWSPDAIWDRGGFGLQQSPKLRFVNGPVSSVDVQVGATTLLVGRIRADEAALWIDPDLVDPGPPDLIEARTPSEPRGLAAFGFNAVGDGTSTIDEFRIGESFAAVVPLG